MNLKYNRTFSWYSICTPITRHKVWTLNPILPLTVIMTLSCCFKTYLNSQMLTSAPFSEALNHKLQQFEGTSDSKMVIVKMIYIALNRYVLRLFKFMVHIFVLLKDKCLKRFLAKYKKIMFLKRIGNWCTYKRRFFFSFKVF